MLYLSVIDTLYYDDVMHSCRAQTLVGKLYDHCYIFLRDILAFVRLVEF